MFTLILALGPFGTCESDLNDNEQIVVWFVSTGVEAVVVCALWVVGGGRIVPRMRWRLLLTPFVSVGAAALVFGLGLAVLLSDTACVD